MSAIAVGDRVKLAAELPAGYAPLGGQEGTVSEVLGPVSAFGGVPEDIRREATRLGFGEQYADDAIALFVRLDSGTEEALTDRQVSLVQSVGGDIIAPTAVAA